MTTEDQAITQVLTAYQDACGRADATAVAALYSSDGVLMAENSPTSVGHEAVLAAYTSMFKTIKLNIKFAIAETRQLSPDWGFIRSTSSGTIGIDATGGSIPEGNQELFLFKKEGGNWKIARYSYSTTLPAAT